MLDSMTHNDAHESPLPMYSLVFRVYGQVQGVNFRSAAVREACKHGLVGFICNTHDGSVYGEAEGTQGSIDKL